MEFCTGGKVDNKQYMDDMGIDVNQVCCFSGGHRHLIFSLNSLLPITITLMPLLYIITHILFASW